MQALVCDDDAAIRFIVSRIIKDSFGCTVRECADGVEALDWLAREKFAFAILDIEMPTMNGVETLEEIRASEATRDLPVIILSRERDETNVMKLMQLGISDYLLKPPRQHIVVAKVEKVIKMLPAAALADVDLQKVQLSQETPALLIDGNLDYRFFFGGQVERYGTLMMAESGAAGIAMFKRSPVRLVFMGGDLGVVTPERLTQKIRDLRPGGVKIVRILDRGQTADPLAKELYDGVMPRSYVPDAFRAAIRPYIFIPGPFTGLTAEIPELRDIVSSAVTQVFGMMFDSDIVPSQEDAALAPDFSAVLEIALQDRWVMDLGVHLPKAAALAATAKMLGMPESDLGDEECLSVAGELGNLITGRAHARFRERSLKSVCSLPKLEQGGTYTSPDEGNGLVQRYALPGGGDFIISLTVQDRTVSSQPAPAVAAA